MAELAGRIRAAHQIAKLAQSSGGPRLDGAGLPTFIALGIAFALAEFSTAERHAVGSRALGYLRGALAVTLIIVLWLAARRSLGEALDGIFVFPFESYMTPYNQTRYGFDRLDYVAHWTARGVWHGRAVDLLTSGIVFLPIAALSLSLSIAGLINYWAGFRLLTGRPAPSAPSRMRFHVQLMQRPYQAIDIDDWVRARFGGHTIAARTRADDRIVVLPAGGYTYLGARRDAGIPFTMLWHDRYCDEQWPVAARHIVETKPSILLVNEHDLNMLVKHEPKVREMYFGYSGNYMLKARRPGRPCASTERGPIDPQVRSALACSRCTSTIGGRARTSSRPSMAPRCRPMSTRVGWRGSTAMTCTPQSSRVADAS